MRLHTREDLELTIYANLKLPKRSMTKHMFHLITYLLEYNHEPSSVKVFWVAIVLGFRHWIIIAIL